MDCPACGAATKVIESRSADSGGAVRRRRKCLGCGRRRTSFERFESPNVVVRKRGGAAQPFDRGKLRSALERAAHKRPVGATELAAIVAVVEAEADGGPEIAAERIAEVVLTELDRLDFGAYLQFAGTLPNPIPQIAGSTPE